ncbi:hypothetical protein BCR36DRAFT_581508 [Piromyces finnis]|uniref:Uncharacterized protein n=1 Tax=Piromyces finnis TaxID=1754191 RepID=A0A1Y1VHJ5_9FUNG|nr:hypothetical protein BCR36DRAFT_581508 [Piromyces finnis]|eukprot:ORX55502.1 hypothetical protein BCR36DRAFT_581508 [Piromyces finnis]
MKQVFSVDSNIIGVGKCKIKWQKRDGQFIAVNGKNNIVVIYNKNGDEVDKINLEGKCTGMDWSPDGELLAITDQVTGVITLWDANNKKIYIQLDTTWNDLSFCQWSKKGKRLAVGTKKGNLFIYDRKASKKVPILGKHTKSIICGCWQDDNIIACGSDDNTFSISDLKGTTLFEKTLKGKPSLMKFATMVDQNNSENKNLVLSMVINHHYFYIHNMDNPENPLELVFQEEYGSIVSYEWYNENHILFGFSNGNFIVMSTDPKYIGQELYHQKSHNDYLSNLIINYSINKVATCGDDMIKIYELSDLKETCETITLDNDTGKLYSLEWSDDGQFIAATTRNGNVYVYLYKLPFLGSTYGTTLAYLTSLQEITLIDQSKTTMAANDQIPPSMKIKVDIEPSLLVVGERHLVVGVNNQVLFYSLLGRINDNSYKNEANSENSYTQYEYLAPIKRLLLNRNYVAGLLTNGKLQIHNINDSKTNKMQKLFPNNTDTFLIICAALTSNFCIFGTNTGVIYHYDLESWNLVNTIKHKTGIKELYPQFKGGIKFIFIDDLNEGYICNPVNNTILSIPGISTQTIGILWDVECKDSCTFVSYDNEFLTTYIFTESHIKGSQCLIMGTTKLSYGLRPILLNCGVVSSQTHNGKICMTQLSTHLDIKEDSLEKERNIKKLLQLLYSLGRFNELWKVYNFNKDLDSWRDLAEKALINLDIKTAKRIYRLIGDANKVLFLNKIEEIEDKNSLCGQISMLLGEYDNAQEFFLRNSDGISALNLRRGLRHWDQALSLASTFAQNEVSIIAKEYALELEFNGDYNQALSMYNKALSCVNSVNISDEEKSKHITLCNAGLIRTTLQNGEISKGMKMLRSIQNKELLQECGSILENLKQYNEAGQLFKRSENYEKAALIFLKAKKYSNVSSILSHITSPKIFLQYAKIKEAEGEFKEAENAYEKAQDYESVVRLIIEHSSNIDKAVEIVRKTRSRESARLISRFFQKINDYKSVIEFCLIADMKEDAFEIAQQHNEMEHLAALLKEDASQDMLLNIASYFENQNQFLYAGKYYIQCGDYTKALKMFMQPNAENESFDMAIECIGLAKNDSLIHMFIDYLMGETDGIRKDTKYFFKLWMSIGKYSEAARTAIIIAREEQNLGNYRATHDVLLEIYLMLTKINSKIPNEIEKMLMLIHSYILIKLLLKLDEHMMASRMLIRVSNNISKFPAHATHILTSTVVECHRVGLKKQSFEYATMLIRPEYKQKLDPKYRRKIEAVIRRPDKSEIEEPSTPCPFCGSPVTETTLDCLECKNHIPYCIVTGQHMVLDDWSNCPSCKFPALYSQFKKLLEKTHTCPMCTNHIEPDAIEICKNPIEMLKEKNDKEGTFKDADMGFSFTDSTSSTQTSYSNILPVNRNNINITV